MDLFGWVFVVSFDVLQNSEAEPNPFIFLTLGASCKLLVGKLY